MKLTAKTITGLILPPGKSDVIHFDDDLPRFGYRLRHASDGKILRSWIVQYKHGGRSSRVRIGAADVIPAEAARAEAKRLLAKVDLGEDPASDRRDRREKDRYSLRSVIDEYLEARRSPQTDRERKDKARVRPKTYRELRRYLLDTFRPLHAMPIDRVTRKDIAFHLARIKRERGVSVEGCARAALNKFFSWAMTMGLIEHNPVIGTPMPSRSEPRSRVLSDEELASIWKACKDDDYGRIIRLCILLGSRRAEIGGIAQSELDLDAPQPSWTLPAERSKNGRKHTLPLMPMALDIIRCVPRMASRNCLFGVHSDKGFAAWDKGWKALVARSGVSGWTPHDLRRTFSTRLHEALNIEPHIVEALLNHYSGHRAGPAGTYNLAKYLPQMRIALALWEDHIRALVEGGERKVFHIGPATAS